MSYTWPSLQELVVAYVDEISSGFARRLGVDHTLGPKAHHQVREGGRASRDARNLEWLTLGPGGEEDRPGRDHRPDGAPDQSRD